MVQILPVTTKKQRKQFVEFPLKLYKGNPYYVPPLYADEMAMFKDDFTYNDQSKSAFFLAYRDGEVVGRIHGIWQFAANEKWGQSRVRFTRFESINDQEVANALLSAVEDWGKSLGMSEIVGPLGYSDMEREGLLVEGFDQLATFEENYNFDYYQTLIENYGYQKDVDWTGNKLYLPKGGIDPKIKTISDKMLEKYNLHFCTETNKSKFLKKYVDKIFAIWEDTYSKIYGTVPFSKRVMEGVYDQFVLMVKPKYVPLILDENDNVIEENVHLSEKTVYEQRGSEVSAEHMNEIGRQLNAINTVNDFPISTTGWVANTNTRNNETYTVMQVIPTEAFANTPTDAQLDCILLSATADSVMTEAEKEDAYKLSSDVTIGATSITVYAEEATTNALRIRVKGV